MSGDLIEIGPGLQVLVRGWLHGNVVIITGEGQAPALIDTGYGTGTAELIEVFEAATGQPIAALGDVLLTHAHSDHAGSCAELRRRSGCRIHASAVCRALIEPWDPRGLWLEATGQAMEPFEVDAELRIGERVEIGPGWRVISLPGHATGGVGLFAEELGLLVSGDALWRDGLGVLLPQIDGEEVFEQAEAALDAIEGLDPRLVVPGHGWPFEGVGAALAKARWRLARWRDDPRAHHKSLVLGLVAFWLLASPGAAQVELDTLLASCFEDIIGGPSASFATWREQLLAGLERDQVLRRRDGRVFAGPGIRAVS